MQCLLFRILDETFALPITAVREVLQDIRITAIPKTPAFIVGVMNLRGQIVPVLDLRRKFGMEAAATTPDTAVIVVEVPFGEKELLAGVRVDGVEAVTTVQQDAIVPPPEMGTLVRLSFLEGMVTQEERLILFLAIARVFTREELNDVAQAGEMEGGDSHEE